MANFAYTILYVKDVAASIEFYEKAFGFQRKFISPDNDYGELSTGTTTLSFAQTALAKTNIPGGFIESDPAAKPFAFEIGFTVDNVEEVFQKALTVGATRVSEPKTKPWGQTVSYVRDPNGFLVEICTAME
ncbi:VOC family protein [Dyadobacter endophyticus]|uniref:Lactoylglutathione lyase n=1 Tax=Dyadobacter endophyticus TaxID=1749036 RepID=A0ABQ1Z3T4_9BACT|nr:VOC family protein [Dyadobacter endophyticus]GGH49160.1 lactoylglutathione lyase [Dyadobacter endophyticus]